MAVEFTITTRGADVAEVSTVGECGRVHRFEASQGQPPGEPIVCSCGTLMLVGHGVPNRLYQIARDHPNRPEAGYSVHRDIVQLPWGDHVEAAVAVPRV